MVQQSSHHMYSATRDYEAEMDKKKSVGKPVISVANTDKDKKDK